MGRPVGVTILAILDFLGAVFTVLAGLGFILGGGMMAAILAHNSQLSSQLPAAVAGIIGGLGVGVGVLMFIFAAIYALVGWGMWGLKNWARIITIAFVGLWGILCALNVLLSLMHFNIFAIIWAGFWLAIYGGILWYLFQPNVVAAFAGRRTMAATA
ncbi:MAG TPA: hypothetical protein VK699_12990 [Terriglobales bacterium]|jgi:hypothetical protein|nr:hypothetical protein [Terriglobales bacterium]